MNLQKRIELLQKLKNYIEENNSQWQEVKARAAAHNAWFTPAFTDIAIANICSAFLDASKLENWVQHYHLDNNISPKNIGVVMAGNIPLVGFHDFLCAFICGHRQTIKLSSKDDVLLKHLVQQLAAWDQEVLENVKFAEILKGCDAYIATGSNNTARYFDQYFAKYPSVIRRNRTSVAVLTGEETADELQLLADDVHIYFGLGCRNVTKIVVPEEYDFVPLLRAFDKYIYLADHHKYKNNYDYQLSLALMNNIFYMTNGAVLLVENDEVFSAISQLHYSFYSNRNNTLETLQKHPGIQCIVGRDAVPFGTAQQPGLFDYADGVDTMQFLLSL